MSDYIPQMYHPNGTGLGAVGFARPALGAGEAAQGQLRYLQARKVTVAFGESWSPKLDGLCFLLLEKGRGEAISSATRQQLAPGDLLVMGNDRDCRVTAETEGMEFWWFSLELEQLFPLCRTNEVALIARVAQRLKPMKKYAAGSSVAIEGHKLMRDLPEGGLEYRGQLLRIGAGALGEELAATLQERTPAAPEERRVEQVLEGLSADELLRLSVAELAERVGCSRRHLSRLFHRYFGLSMAGLKMEMRLMKAAMLLRDPNEKVCNVAAESGFSHLGLFSICFRKRFGVSPTEWRRRPSESQRESGASAETTLHEAASCSARVSSTQVVVGDKLLSRARPSAPDPEVKVAPL